MSPSPVRRLSMMMFLQYVVWGIWLPILARYLQAPIEQGGLGFTPGQVGWILGLAGSVGAVSGPFIAGQIADRYFSAERFLVVLLVVGGLLKIVTAYQTTFVAWLWLSVAYSVVYTPTLALTNSLAFSHLKDPSRQFPLVRVWGTIGWIAASWIFPLVWLLSDVRFSALPPFYSGTELADSTHRLVDSLIFSGVISLGYAVYTLFFVPHTPPKPDAVEKLAFAKAFGLLRKRSFLVLVVASLPISVIHQIYFMQTAPFFSSLGLRDSQIGPAMTIGQFAEIAVMLLTGWLLARLGFRWVIVIGALAYFARYGIFGTESLPTAVIVGSQFLHGLCYACFFAAAYIYVDRISDPDTRHSTQTVFGIIILGVGPIVAAPLLGLLANIFGDGSSFTDYSGLWYTLAVVGLVTALGVAVFFRDESKGPASSAMDG